MEWECVGEPVGVGSSARNNHGSLVSGECRSPCVLTLLSVFVIDPFEWLQTDSTASPFLS